MTRAFGTTSHSEIMQAFERENREHTFVEQLTTGEYAKKYQLRVSLEKLFVILDSLGREGSIIWGDPGLQDMNTLACRQLRAEILATLGLYEEG